MAVSNPSRSFSVQPLSLEEEDRIILERIQFDDRPLRRVLKKFHTYLSFSHTPIVPLVPGANDPTNVDDAREAFQTELASFELLLKKTHMICEAEARQVQEYQRERQRIDAEHETLKAQIEELKVALEYAQMLRRRKIEYDLVAEKINTLPAREELEISIQSLENDMLAIRAEHETQQRVITSQKVALDTIVQDLTNLRFLGKDPEPTPSAPQSPRETALDIASPGSSLTSIDSDDEGGEREEGEEDEGHKTMTNEEALSEGAIEEDIEMGEVEEVPKDSVKSRKKAREDMEEGEATDASSELSDPPDD